MLRGWTGCWMTGFSTLYYSRLPNVLKVFLRTDTSYFSIVKFWRDKTILRRTIPRIVMYARSSQSIKLPSFQGGSALAS